MGEKKRVLATAFLPFAGEPINPAQQIWEALTPPPDIELTRLLLPVTFEGAPKVLQNALEHDAFDAALLLGQAGGRDKITVERIAVNIDDASIPDEAGFQPVDAPIVRDAPAAYFATLPVKRMVEAMRSVGIPAAVSNSAGTFVCNHIMYHALYALRDTPTRAGFVHVPFLPEQARRHNDAPSMSFADMLRGIEALLPVL